MKFWQLSSVVQDNLIIQVSHLKPEWTHFGSWIAEINAICDRQDREILDCELPCEFCREVLKQSKQKFYLSNDCLRSYRVAASDIELSALSAFDRFGGEAIEDTKEKGSWPIGGFQ